MAVQIPRQAVQDAQQADSGLWKLLLAIAGPESGWNPGALGDWKLAWGGPIVPRDTPGAFPTSFGYLQMYTDGGLGNGHSQAELLDGVSNFRLGAQQIRADLAAGKTPYEALWPWSARPAAWELYLRIESEGIEGVSDSTPPIPGPSPEPGGSPPGSESARAPLVLLAGLALIFWWIRG